MNTTRVALAIWLTANVSYGQDTGQKITVCLQFGVTDRLTLGPRAQELAAKMFADAGIFLEWKSGASRGELPPAAIVIDTGGETRPDFMPGVLAYAEPFGGRIRVFLDRVEKLENPAVVLAHVLVHEITHMLQGIGRHSETGVMKPRWTGRDYSEMRVRPLPFTPQDLVLIRQGCPIVWVERDRPLTRSALHK